MTGEQHDRDRWNDRYLAQTELAGPPFALEPVAHLLPAEGLAIDLAGGDGAGAQYLAERGLSPVLVEVSDVALRQAMGRTFPDGGQLETVNLDLSQSSLAEVLAVAAQGRPVAVVICLHYLQPGLLVSVASDLPAGATFVCAIATTTNLERNERPSRRFLLEPGELRRLVLGEGEPPSDVQVLLSREAWNDRNQHEAVLVIQRAG